ncbi:MAG TPA: LLM class flavin-dependent oxidoreductase [Actinomycetota bacterium]|nr:LLM class flavin-dependent oxidoreductase [Actinomycetota bacterium]
MSKVLLGATLPQFTKDRAQLIDGARHAEAAGLDSIWVFDHLWPLSGGRDRPVLEAWSTLAYLAGATEKILIGTLVTRSSLRHPALLAKMIASVATIAPGRLIVGIGSGDTASRDENEAFGLPYYAGADRIGQLKATVGLLHDYLHDDVVTSSDSFAPADGLVPSPKPDIRPKVWVGGRADDVLETAGRVADGWNGWAGTPRTFARDAQQVLAYADGRDVELSWGGICVVGATDDVARKKLGTRDATKTLWGGPDMLAARLAEFVGAGAGHLIVTPAGSADPEAYEILGEVGPRLP